MSFAIELANEGFMLVLVLLAPIAAAIVLATLATSVLSTLTGWQDQTIPALARALAVIAALAIVGSALATGAREFTLAAFSRLPDVGRGPP